MCRWMAYKGAPIYLEDVIYKPSHCLIEQSLHAEESKLPTNGDGFGIGWYGERTQPGVYRETLPVWNDANLQHLAHQIRSNLFFAHIRASTGTETTRPNCHPFGYGDWLFMHNGQVGGYKKIRRALEGLIPDHLYSHRVGTTDSEVLFYLLLDQDLETDPAAGIRRMLESVQALMDEAKISAAFRFTAALTNGKQIFAARYSSDNRPPTLYYASRDDHVSVVSEPFDPEDHAWHLVPPNHLLLVQEDGQVETVPIH